MANEEEKVDLHEVPEIELSQDENGNDTTDWKAIAEAHREVAVKNYAIAKRYKTKAEKAKDANPPAKKEEKKSFDYGELSYLAQKGVSDEDIDFVQDTVNKTGKELKELMTAKWFQAELKERQEARETQNAIPKPTGRAAPSAKDEVDFWLNKGELPPVDQVELRRKVVNARLAKEKSGSIFTSNPVV